MISSISIDQAISADVVDRFKKSGLWADMQDPEKSVTLLQAEEMVIQELEEYGIMAGSIPSAGIQSYNDRIMLQRLMPRFNKYLSFT